MNFLYLLLSGIALAQAPAGTTEVTADGCKLYLPSADAKGASRVRWSGQCKDGLADGRGVVRIYSGGKVARVSEITFAAGKAGSAGEAYFIRGGQAIRSRGGDQLEIAASELPTWALELSMLVEDRPVRAAPAKPAPPSKPAQQVADEKAAAERANKVDEEKAAADKAAAEAKRQAAEAERLAKAKAAEEKAAAAKAAKEAEAKRLAAEKERAAAQAKAASEKRAAEKAAADAKAVVDAKVTAEAKAAAERAAAAEKLSQEKAAAEARAAAEAKAAADAKTAADAKAAADSKAAAEVRAAADDKAAAEAKVAADKLAAERLAQQKVAAASAPFIPGRGFGDAGSGEALRAVVAFTLTTDDGRNLGVATFVAGKGEAQIKQNAIALAQTYEKVSPFHAKLLEQPTVITTCGGAGYVVEARVTYPATKSYGWFAGCMGDNIDGTAKVIQQIEDQMHKDFKATPTSFWAYQYMIIGYVDEAGMRGRAEYERVARPNLMAPGRVMVLSRPDQWAECTSVANKDPKLKDKAACLKEAMDKLKPGIK